MDFPYPNLCFVHIYPGTLETDIFLRTANKLKNTYLLTFQDWNSKQNRLSVLGERYQNQVQLKCKSIFFIVFDFDESPTATVS